MAQSGYTPILIYASGTTGNTPSAGNLTSSSTGAELALNYYDGKLFYKDASGVVQLLASKATSVNVASLSFGTTGLTPNTATTGAITVAGTLITSNGGTGLASYTAGDLPYYASGTALSKLAIGTSGQILTSSGTAPQWSTLSGVAVTTFSGGTTGLTPSSATSGAITLAGTLAVGNGGTGLTTLTSGYIPYGNGTSAFSSTANFLFDGTNLNLKSSGNLNFVYGSSSQGINFQNGVGTTIQQIKYLDSNGSLTIGGASGTGVPIIFNYASSAEAMRISSTGLVGIGTSSPTQTLDVNGIALFEGSAQGNIIIQKTGTNGYSLFSNSAGTLGFYNQNTSSQAMTLTNAGYLGIGTTSPNTYLDVTTNTIWGTATTPAIQISNIGSAGNITIPQGLGALSWYTNNAPAAQIEAVRPVPTNGNFSALVFRNNLGGGTTLTETMRLDSSGNLGLGVTPSAWATYKPLQIGQVAISGTGTDLELTSNAYYNAGWKYGITSGGATRYSQQETAYGVHAWYTAPSGTAGNAISFTQAMTLDNSGNLLVGTTSFALSNSNSLMLSGATGGAYYAQHASGTASGTIYSVFVYNGSSIGSISQSGTTAVLYNTSSDQRLKTNIVDAPSGNIDAIKVRSFDWISDNTHQTYGMVAQELVEVAPYAVTKPENPDEMMGVDYSKLVPMMIKEIQDLKAEVNQLKQKIGV